MVHRSTKISKTIYWPCLFFFVSVALPHLNKTMIIILNLPALALEQMVCPMHPSTHSFPLLIQILVMMAASAFCTASSFSYSGSQGVPMPEMICDLFSMFCVAFQLEASSFKTAFIGCFQCKKKKKKGTVLLPDSTGYLSSLPVNKDEQRLPAKERMSDRFYPKSLKFFQLITRAHNDSKSIPNSLTYPLILYPTV